MKAINGMHISALRNSFSNTGTAMSTSVNYLRTITMNDNVINDSRIGIDCYDNQGSVITINNNTINAGSVLKAIGVFVNEILFGTTNYQIRNNTIQQVRHGIFANGIKNSIIDENIVYLKHTLNPSQYCYGIGLTKSEGCNVVANWVQGQNDDDLWVNGIYIDNSVSNYVTCNEAHTVGDGMFFGGVQTPNTYIAKNLMDNNHRGLILNYGIVGPQRTISGSSTLPNDNRWINGFSSSCYTLSHYSDGTLSPFYVRPTGVQYNPSIVPANNCSFSGSPITFINASGINALSCPLIVLPVVTSAQRSVMLQIAGDSINPSEFVSSTKEMLKQSLYKYLLVDSSLVPSEPLLQEFIVDPLNNGMKRLIGISNNLADSANRLPSRLQDLLVLNNSVTPSNDVQANSKWMNGILIENLVSGANFSSAQLSDLRILAEKCPYNDGYAVYQARAILSQYDTIDYKNTCETVPDNNQRSITALSTSTDLFELFPNPSTGNMTLSYSLSERSIGEVKLFDISGKLISNYVLQAGKDNKLFIREEKLNNGVYFYKVSIDGELIVSDKFVIIK
jgi:hypothetical protein